MRNQKDTYCLIFDDSKKYYTAVQHGDGTYEIKKDSRPYPIQYNPINLENVPFEFGTNEFYNSLNRSVVEPLTFIKDGAAILRYFYHLGKGTQAVLNLLIIDWDGKNKYVKSYSGRFDFGKKKEQPDGAKFTIPLVDNSPWGLLSQNDETEYAIECNAKNPKAIKVLYDGILLKNRFTYQTVQAPISQPVLSEMVAGIAIPFVLINEDGDSSGIVTSNQTGFAVTYDIPGSPTFDLLKTVPGGFLGTAYALPNVGIAGTFMFQYNNDHPLTTGAGISVSIRTSKGRRFPIYSSGGALTDGKIYTVNFTINEDLEVSETLFFILEFGNPGNGESNVTITPIVTNIVVTVFTKAQPVVAYGLRPLDLLQQIVSKATNGKFTIGSNFFVEHNKDICLSGDSLRQIPNAKIYTSFKQFFKTFDTIYWMALRTINDLLWMEDYNEVYRQDSTILDIGECINIETEPAYDKLINSLDIGSPDVDMRHPSGRLEFNTVNSFSFPMEFIKNKMEVISEYHLGCFEQQFLILDYQNESTKDNSGDKKMFVVKITDEIGSASEDIETFENVSIDDAPLNPFIKFPLDNDIIGFNKPRVRGIAKPGDNVNIYVDNVFDGNTVADADGNWEYNIDTELDEFIDGVQTGIHVIDATFTDEVAPKYTINIQIDTSVPTLQEIIYPQQLSNLYNNKPLIMGYAPNTQNIDISLDGVVIGSTVAGADCRWEFKVVTPITNGAHNLSINAGIDSVDFNVEAFTAFPIITYVGSELDGFPIINNLPLIEGVGIPGTTFDLWLNYIDYPGSKLGTVTIDANGNWSYQVVPVTYLDPSSGTPIVIAPIQNGLNIISTSLENHTVKVGATGYLLSRPPYNSITGVLDNSVFNTEYSPMRLFKRRNALWASILNKQIMNKVSFQKSTKNGLLRTVLNGEVIAENDSPTIASLGTPNMLMEIATIKTKAEKTFATLLRNFNKGGIIKTTYKGNDIYCLPIGSMKINTLHSSEQEWKLLMSPLTTYTTLLNLYRTGVLIKLNKNSMFHSDYNTLHLIKYNYELPSNYKIKDIYDDWFHQRNDQWVSNPFYRQKLEREVIKDQIITNGVSNVIFRLYRCRDAKIIDAIPYQAVNPAVLNPPEIVQEITLDFNIYPNDSYFGAWFVGETCVGITEAFETRTSWPGTIKIESSSSQNLVGFAYSTGIKTVIRVEGMIEKRQPDIDNEESVDQNRYSKTIYSRISNKRKIRFGTAFGLPDYLYLKIACAINLDKLYIENTAYSLKDGNKIEPVDEYEGHPLYYYVCNFDFVDNQLGVTVDTPDITGRKGVILVMDGEAVGLPVDTLYNIELNNE